MNKFLLFFSAILILSMSACDNGILIGEDLLDDEEIGTLAREDFQLAAKTLAGEPINTLVKGRDSRAYHVGTIVDPIFGTYSGDAYFAMRYAGLPNFFDAVVDSVVLVLQYEASGVYGDTLATHTLTVHRVTEDFVRRDSVDSEEQIAFDDIPLGSKTFVPNAKDSLTLLSRTGEGATLRVPAQIRVPLDNALGAELLADSLAATSDTTLLESLKGLRIAATSDNNAMLSVRFDDAAFSSLNLYYTQGDTAKRIFTYPLRREVFARLQHNYEGAPVREFIDDDLLGDSLIFLQAFKGVDADISLGDLDQLRGDYIVNKATMTLTVAELAEDLPLDLYPVCAQLLASRLDDNGNRVLIQDLIKTGDINGDGLVIFGGDAEEIEQADGTTVTQYILNVTDYVKAAIDQQIADPKIILTPFSRQESPRNAVIYGPGHSKYPAKLRITYTEL